MAPFTCKVVDAANRGQPGVYVVLECKDHMHQSIKIMESLTDEDGEIDMWFPNPVADGEDQIEPQIVDSTVVPRISLTFFPHTTSTSYPGPFLSIHTDLFLEGDESHEITLLLDSDPRLQYSSSAATSHSQIFGPAVPPSDQLVPSPFLLPPPISPISEALPMLEDSMPAQGGGQKRKLQEEGPEKANKRHKNGKACGLGGACTCDEDCQEHVYAVWDGAIWD